MVVNLCIIIVYPKITSHSISLKKVIDRVQFLPISFLISHTSPHTANVEGGKLKSPSIQTHLTFFFLPPSLFPLLKFKATQFPHHKFTQFQTIDMSQQIIYWEILLGTKSMRNWLGVGGTKLYGATLTRRSTNQC